MQRISELAALFLRGLVKVALLLIAIAFLAGVVFLGLLMALYLGTRFLFTGRKPAFVTTFHRFRQTAHNYQKGRWPGSAASSAPGTGDVVDVESREVASALAPPPITRQRTD